MQQTYSPPLANFTKAGCSFLVLFFLLAFSARAQNRNFGIVYSANLRGGTALIGNTLMNVVNNNGSVNSNAMNGNSATGNSIYENGNTNMQYVDIDGNAGVGAGTRNSSSADLILPAGTNTIKLARLYWGGRAEDNDFDMSQAVNRTIKIRKGTSGAYQEFSATQVDRNQQGSGRNAFTIYQAYADITTLVTQQGAGTYTVGNGSFSTGDGGGYGNFGAWSIVVVYENSAEDFNSVRLYDGFQEIYNGGSSTTNTITLSGLNVPSGALALADAQLGVISWEGDSKYNGDFLKINGTSLSNALNPISNTWNGTITNNGTHVTTKNPNYTDQMGVDIDQFNIGVGYGISPNASNVTIQFGTVQDQYFTGVVSFVIKMKAPGIKLTKTVKDANNDGFAEAGEMLTYTLKGKNIGVGNANAVVFKDSLPPTMTYVNGSLKIHYAPGLGAMAQTDALGDDWADYSAASTTICFKAGTGATPSVGGSFGFNDSAEIEFKVIVNNPIDNQLPAIINVARLEGVSDALVNYVDDATASIAPVVAPLPVTLVAFTANYQQNQQVKIAWSSSMEMNCHRYEVERSEDGIHFNTIGSQKGNGNSALLHQYEYQDDVAAIASSVIYYRLKQIDFDGKSSLFNVVAVKLPIGIESFTVSPNPFHRNAVVHIDWNKAETVSIKVLSASGSTVWNKKVDLKKGSNNIDLNALANLPKGSYLVQIGNGSSSAVKQIIKQ